MGNGSSKSPQNSSAPVTAPTPAAFQIEIRLDEPAYSPGQVVRGSILITAPANASPQTFESMLLILRLGGLERTQYYEKVTTVVQKSHTNTRRNRRHHHYRSTTYGGGQKEGTQVSYRVSHTDSKSLLNLDYEIATPRLQSDNNGPSQTRFQFPFTITLPSTGMMPCSTRFNNMAASPPFEKEIKYSLTAMALLPNEVLGPNQNNVLCQCTQDIRIL